MIVGYIYVALLTALTVLSVRTLTVMKPNTLWTAAGWIFTILYDCGASYEIVSGHHHRFEPSYVCLAGLVISFVVAGVRDEPQADPWWWPNGLAPTRAERANARLR